MLPEKEEQVQTVGAPIIICKSDLKKIAPWWLYFTQLIRQDPECKVTASWIAEMHGYALASAYLGINHTLMNDLADRTPYNEKDPYILHYDLEHTSVASGESESGIASGESESGIANGERENSELWNKRNYMYDLLEANGKDNPMPIPKSGNINFRTVFKEINNGVEKTRASLWG